MPEILAKSRNSITLKEHTKELWKQEKNLSEKIEEVKKCEDLLKIAIFAHDFGKVSPSFQVSLKNWDYKPRPLFPDVPHSIFSLLWVDEKKLKEKIEDENDRKVVLSAIAFHHFRDNFQEIILGTNKDFKKAIKLLLQDEKLRNKMIKNLKSEFNDEYFEECKSIIAFNEEFARTIVDGNDLLNDLFPPYFGYFLPYRVTLNEKTKKKLVNILGTLMRVDHFASYVQEEGIDEKIEKEIPSNDSIQCKIKEKLSGKIWQIEKSGEVKDQNVVLIAPTGSGKTEFAFLWGAGKKLFFTLPLRSAVNSIFDRSLGYFGEGNCGLLHSDADVYLFTKDTKDEGESLRVLDLARQLSLPLLVSTGDQIFPTALRYPGYEKIFSTLSYSRLVIDEVQAYDPQAVAIIVKLIEDVTKLGGKFLLMTATLPSFVEEEIKERVGEDQFKTINKYDECNDFCKHMVEVRENDISCYVNKILEKAKDGKRVMVILNTVSKAQEIYEKVKEQAKDSNRYVKLLHSKFTLNDRKRLEEELIGTKNSPGKFCNPKSESEKEGKILVATQVVEASLDIDADILYTELAPMDSLIQRMGRILRRFRIERQEKVALNEPNIIVCFSRPNDEKKLLLESGKGYVYQNEILLLTLAQLLRNDLKKLKKNFFNKNSESNNDKSKKSKTNKKPILMDLLNEILQGTDAQEKKGRKNKKKNEGLAETNGIRPPLTIKEGEKNELVNELYDALEGSDYLKKFYQTLDILDAGYMSDRKGDALNVFRHIYTVPAIPETRKDDFKRKVEEYSKKDNFNYTSFKAKVLGDFVINIDIRKFLRGNSLFLPPASDLLKEIEITDKEKIQKLNHWLKDTYLCYGDYDNEKGFTFTIPKSDSD